MEGVCFCWALGRPTWASGSGGGVHLFCSSSIWAYRSGLLLLLVFAIPSELMSICSTRTCDASDFVGCAVQAVRTAVVVFWLRRTRARWPSVRWETSLRAGRRGSPPTCRAAMRPAGVHDRPAGTTCLPHRTAAACLHHHRHAATKEEGRRRPSSYLETGRGKLHLHLPALPTTGRKRHVVVVYLFVTCNVVSVRGGIFWKEDFIWLHLPSGRAGGRAGGLYLPFFSLVILFSTVGGRGCRARRAPRRTRARAARCARVGVEGGRAVSILSREFLSLGGRNAGAERARGRGRTRARARARGSGESLSRTWTLSLSLGLFSLIFSLEPRARALRAGAVRGARARARGARAGCSRRGRTRARARARAGLRTGL